MKFDFIFKILVSITLSTDSGRKNKQHQPFLASNNFLQLLLPLKMPASTNFLSFNTSQLTGTQSVKS